MFRLVVTAHFAPPVFCFDVDVQRIYRGFLFLYSPALQGHAIKNQDLLIASGAVTLKGAEGMSDLDEDMQIAVRALRFLISVAPLGVLGVPRQRGAWESSLLLVADVALLFRFSDPPLSNRLFDASGFFAAVFTRLFPRASYLTAATPETKCDYARK